MPELDTFTLTSQFRRVNGHLHLAPFLGSDKTVYIRVSGSFPQGRVSHVNVNVT